MRSSITSKDHQYILREYLQRKHDWSDDVFNTIDWTYFQEVLDKRPIHKSTNLIKYIHGWQHVRQQKQHMNASSADTKCPLCGVMEQQHHYMVCRCSTAIQHRTKAWITLKRKLQLIHTKPSIIAALGHVIHTNFDPREHDLLSTDDDDENLVTSIREQHIIGWKHMFMGRFSHYWNITQKYFCHRHPTYILDGDHHISRDYNKWRSSFLLALIQFGLDLWDSRNNIVHGETPKEQRFLRRKKALKLAKAKFNEGEETVGHPQRRLFINFDRRLEGSTRSIEAWTEMVEIAQSRRREELKELARQPDLFTFSFTQTHTRNDRQMIQQEDMTLQPTVQHSIRLNEKHQKRVQQNLRQMLL